MTNPWDWQGGGLRNLILGGAGDGTVAGVIRDGSLAAQTSGVVKHGAGTWTLAGSNTYTGATTVQEGTLLVNGSTAAGSSVTVNAGGTLGGEGTIGGATTIGAGGTLSPGAAGIGTLTFEDHLTLEDGAAWHWKFFDTAEYDQVVAGAGSLILPESGTIGLGIYGTEGHSVGLHDQFTIFDGAVQNFDAALFELENHSNWTEGWSISEVAPGAGLLLTAVPEPGAALLLLCALVCGLFIRRR